jgi:transposase
VFAAWLSPPVAADQTKARRQHAHLALSDERGLRMGPLVRRTGGPRGETPVLVQRGAHRQQVSGTAAWGRSPRRDRLGLFVQTRVDGSFDNWTVAAFLEAMWPELAGRLVVGWDGGPRHQGDPIRAPETQFADRLNVERWPPFAPELDPVELLWSWRKGERLSHFAPHDAIELDGRVVTDLEEIREDQEFLRNLFHTPKLPLSRTLFF